METNISFKYNNYCITAELSDTKLTFYIRDFHQASEFIEYGDTDRWLSPFILQSHELGRKIDCVEVVWQERETAKPTVVSSIPLYEQPLFEKTKEEVADYFLAQLRHALSIIFYTLEHPNATFERRVSYGKSFSKEIVIFAKRKSGAQAFSSFTDYTIIAFGNYGKLLWSEYHTVRNHLELTERVNKLLNTSL